MHSFGLALCLLATAAGAAVVDAREEAAQAGAVGPRAQGLYTGAQAARGKAVYTEQCALCHLEDLSGDQLYNPGPALAGEVFRARWKGRTVQELFTVTKGTMPYTMPGTLTDREVADLIAYIFEVNKFPSGSSELPAEHDMLANLRIPARE